MKILWVDFTLPYLLKDADYPVGGWAVELRSWLIGAEKTENPAGVLTWAGATDYVGQDLPFELVETYDPTRGIRYLKYISSYVPALVRAVKRTRPDVVIQASASAMTGMACYAAQQAGVPFVYRVANDMDVDDRYKARLKRYEQLMYRYGLARSALVLCQNRYQYDGVRKTYPHKPAIMLPNPYGFGKILPPKPLSARRYVAWLGIFQYQKNLPLLLRIAQSLPDLAFRIAGSSGRTADAPTDQALAGLRELPNVEFVGYLKRGEILPFLTDAAVLLNTSRYEGFSNTYLESFSCGTPVIAPTGADPDGIIGKLDLGRSIGDEDDFATAIRGIWGLGEAYRDLADRCQAYVREKHDPALLVAEMVEHLRPLVNARQAR
jgi:glycosyltransferase involved in cell wall biosynthesis